MKKLSNNFSISGPINNDIIKALKAQGVSKIVNVRPDNEELGQANSEQLAITVRSHGIKYFHIPVKANHYSEHDITEFSKLIINIDDKVHAFCRTGNRAAHLWALAKTHFKALKYIKKECEMSGCDISSIIERMQEIERKKLCINTNN
jgi:uncharacterized protein (TIGR01244 family)